MSISKNIDSLLRYPKDTEESLQMLLNTMTVREQEQLIDAMYLGRNHIHCQEIREEDLPISINRQSHLSNKDFASILYGKRASLETYFNSAIRCASQSNIDLNEI